MKKIMIIAGVAFASILSLDSCVENFEPNAVEKVPTIQCVTPGETKTSIDGATVKWASGDKVDVIKFAGNTTQKAIYTLTDGAGSKYGTFGYTSGTQFADDEVAIFYPQGGEVYTDDWYEGWYYRIPENQPLIGYSSEDANTNTRQVPMTAKGKIGGTFSFTHMASLLRFKIKNTYSDPLVINKIEFLSDQSLLPRMRAKYSGASSVATVTVFERNAGSIQSTGSVTIDASQTKNFDYVVGPGNYKLIRIKVSTTTKDFVFEIKSDSGTQIDIGNSYVFDTELSSSSEVPAASYQMCIDSTTYVNYKPGSLESSLSISKSISFKTNNDRQIWPSDQEKFLEDIAKLNGKCVVLDMSDLQWGTTWRTVLPTNTFTHIHFPKTVTNISDQKETYSQFRNCASNVRVHIRKGVTNIGKCMMSNAYGYSCYDEGAGYVVDNENTKYRSIDGALYSKDTTVLYDYPSRLADSISLCEGIKTIHTYSLSNKPNIKVWRMPESLLQISDNVIVRCSNLKAVYFQTKTPPSINSNNFKDIPSTVIVVIDTGNDQDDVNAKAAYVTALSGCGVGEARIKTRKEYEK